MTILFLSSNFNKYFYWSTNSYFTNGDDKLKQLGDDFNQVISDTMYLESIQHMNENILVPEIKYDKEIIFNIVLEKVRADGLKFKYKYEKFSQSHNMILLEYLLNEQHKKGQKFVLNEDSLKYISDDLFKKKFKPELLRRKCSDYGFEFYSS